MSEPSNTPEPPAPEQIEVMREAAKLAASRAYAPYSNFHVGAAILDESGGIHSGCNVENVSFGLTICAERNAIGQAVAVGAPRPVAVLIYTPTDTPTPPCGACRQVLAEFNPDMTVILANDEPHSIVTTMRELLPGSFHSGNLR